MGASSYTWLIDSTPLRIAMNAAAFTVWFGAAFGLMFFSMNG